MVIRRPLLLLAISLVTGCQSFGSREAPEPSERWQGSLNIAGERARFTPCGDPRYFALSLPSDLISPMQTLARGRDALFIDFRARRETQKADTSRSTLHLTELLRVQAEGAGCDDLLFPRLVIKATGSEPDWSVEITRQGMLLERPGQPPLALPYLEEQLPGGARNFSSEANDVRVELWVAPERCENPASGTLTQLTATLSVDSETLRGCAYPGAAGLD